MSGVSDDLKKGVVPSELTLIPFEVVSGLVGFAVVGGDVVIVTAAVVVVVVPVSLGLVVWVLFAVDLPAICEEKKRSSIFQYKITKSMRAL